MPEHPTHHRTIAVDGTDVFYREAGPQDAPVVLLLHGFPTFSHQFRALIPALAHASTSSRRTCRASGSPPRRTAAASPTPSTTWPRLSAGSPRCWG